MRFWHIAHPSWTPDQPLRSRNGLAAQGVHLPWLWDEAEEGTDGDVVCLFPDTAPGRREAEWLLDDRPGYHKVRVDLPRGYAMTRAAWEPYPAVRGEIPVECFTLVERGLDRDYPMR